MNNQPNFYSVIIGTELLNGRRKDAHFAFLNSELLKRGYEQKASFVIKDDPIFMEDVFNLIQQDPHSVMFCFGGIGATPDDFTRKVAAKAFTHGKMHYNEVAKELIINQFGEETFPHRIEMSNLPIGAKLLDNVVNNVPGFYLEDRFFFTPGFPSMSQAMVLQALNCYFKENVCKKYRKTMTIYTGENAIIPLMKTYSNEVEISSLPRIKGEKRETVLSIVGEDEALVKRVYVAFEEFLKNENIVFLEGEIA
ncbi:MAG: competence/damage-inducible protein A [Candidatus Marinarcus sp.]|uniref:competence/damage-inducible protein A n=1 Tax=Candidatus Marinarcus sp. TaxID=3100987 RepID=UPI003B00E2AC